MSYRPKQNKWKNGAYFNKQIDRMTSSGMSRMKAEAFAKKIRG